MTFTSRFGGGELTPQQHLSEAMCARRSRHETGGEPPPLFWRLPRWKREYALQARHAARLLSAFPHAAVLAALRSPGGRGVYSLGAPWLFPLVQAEAARLAALPTPKPTTFAPALGEYSPPPRKPGGLLSRLEEADRGQA